MIASRVAADLQQQSDLTVETITGGLGELSVDLDGVRIFKSSRLWYPTPGSVIQKVKETLNEA